MTKGDKLILHQAVIASKIITIRDEKVILDVHLAELYEVETRVLKQAVRRNKDRFPNDFMYELTENEIEGVVSQNVIPSKRHLGGANPFAFTENGVAMLSSVLNSKRAIEVNIAIMRTFTMLRRMMFLQNDVMQEISHIRKQLSEHDNNITFIWVKLILWGEGYLCGKKGRMEIGIIKYFLPEELLEKFEVVSLHELGELATKKMILEI